MIFAAEIGSRSTFRVDEGPKLDIYSRDIKAAEYLYSNPPVGVLRLWRLGPNGYDEVAPRANGRVRSEQLDLEFGIEDGFLWIYTLDGERLLTYEEAERARLEAERRLAEELDHRRGLERRLAELEAEREQRGPRE